jgi:hypothetical protein
MIEAAPLTLGQGTATGFPHNNMTAARIAIAILGILFPYIARLPGGTAWVSQYTGNGVGAFMLLGAFNAVAWGSMIALSFLFRRPASLLFPCVAGFTFLAWAHYKLDLAADAQAAVALVFIPVFALLPIAVGGVFGYFFDRFTTPRSTTRP